MQPMVFFFKILRVSDISQVYIFEYLYKIIDIDGEKEVEIYKAKIIKINWKVVNYLFGTFELFDLSNLILSDWKNNVNCIEN